MNLWDIAPISFYDIRVGIYSTGKEIYWEFSLPIGPGVL